MPRTLWLSALPMLTLVSVASAQSDGATEHFGRGIDRVTDNGSTVRLDLRAEAHGLLLRVAENQPVVILRAGEFPAGQTEVRLPARNVEVAHVTTTPGSVPRDAMQADRDTRQARRDCELSAAGQDRLIVAMRHAECQGVNVRSWEPPTTTTLQRAPSREYLVLVVSDLPLDTADVLARLATLPRFEPATFAHDAALHLVGQRSAAWAGYLARR